jgi:hypothetical protein
MTTNVTDISEYRDRKVVQGLSDQRLKDRITLVQGQLKGWDNPRLQAFYEPMAFPEGFDPVQHPEDNIQLLEEEYARRNLKD